MSNLCCTGCTAVRANPMRGKTGKTGSAKPNGQGFYNADAVAVVPKVAGAQQTFHLPVDAPLGVRLSASNIVLDMKPGMAAATAGLTIDDLVQSVDGQSCEAEWAALDLLKKKPEGLSAREVVVWRPTPASPLAPASVPPPSTPEPTGA